MRIILVLGALIDIASRSCSAGTPVGHIVESNTSYQVEAWAPQEYLSENGQMVFPAGVAHMSVLDRASGKRWESPLDFCQSVNEIVMVGTRQFATICTLVNSYGDRIDWWKISEGGIPEKTESLRCFWPHLGPDRKWIFYMAWYARTGLPGRSKPKSTWLVDVTRGMASSLLVYPPDNPSGREADGREHVALLGSPGPLWSEDGKHLYYFEYLRDPELGTGLESYLIAVDLPDISKRVAVTAYGINVGNFLDSSVPPDVPFIPKEIHWVKDGGIAGTLQEDGVWRNTEFHMTTDGKSIEE